MSSSYWQSEINRLNANQPKYGSYYDKSFVDRLNAAQNDINSITKHRDQVGNEASVAQNDYDVFHGNMTQYSDAYKSAEDKFGVTTYKDSYDSSKAALAMTEQTLNALPSSINSRSNVVYTKAQREANYNIEANKLNNMQVNQQKAISTYEQAWSNAREGASAYAQSILSGEQSKLGELQTMWAQKLDEFNKLGNDLTNAKTLYQKIQSDYESEKQRQYQLQLATWQQQLNNATTRYNADLASEQAAAQAEARRRAAEAQAAAARRAAERAIAERNAYIANNIWNFGNGLELRRGANNTAEYYRNGNRITAGQFLEQSGARGANWSLWNDIWSKGVSTVGVGSDTVEAFNRRTAIGSQYDYLWSF